MNGDWEYDIAVLHISPFKSGLIGLPVFSRIGDYMGYLGMRLHPCNYQSEMGMWRITGYPGDKPRGTLWNTGVCQNWSHTCGSRKTYHMCDTYEGMSGSAIRDGGNNIVAVHTNGGSMNSGVAINSFHLSNIQYW
jgi:V8-like Glu-specific endopeptidase